MVERKWGGWTPPVRGRVFEGGRGVSRKSVPVFVGKDPGIPDVRILELKFVLRPDEAADILRMSQSKVYELCGNGTLECIRIDRAIRIKSSAIRRLLGI